MTVKKIFSFKNEIYLIRFLLFCLLVFAITAGIPKSLDWFPQINSIGLRFDLLSNILFIMISILAVVISEYSYQYLLRDSKQIYFYRYFFITIVFVSLLVLSTNLFTFFLMWFCTSMGLDKLLKYYDDRPLAKIAAMKKFYISRIGDCAIILAIILTYNIFHTLSFNDLFQIALSTSSNDLLQIEEFNWIGLLFVIGAMTKSAQFPFHFWLAETMEAPTPVSALMHAGIINAGGFLIIRLSPILQFATFAHYLLVIVGAISAVFGALVMITQNDIKKKLAYSTVSQMGIMIFTCGLGAFSLALFHIIAHSFYKAHSFLSTGTLVQESKVEKIYPKSLTIIQLAFIIFLGFTIMLFGLKFANGNYFAHSTYFAVLFLGLAQNLFFKNDNIPYYRLRVFIPMIIILIIALLISSSVEYFLHDALVQITPEYWGIGTGAQSIACWISYAIFSIGFIFSSLFSPSKGIFLQRIYLYFWNGGYFSQKTQMYFYRKLKKG